MATAGTAKNNYVHGGRNVPRGTIEEKTLKTY